MTAHQDGGSTRSPALKKARMIEGHHVVLRDATIKDAAFILHLRTDPDRGRYLSATSADLDAQIGWLQRYEADQNQAYFIIQDRHGRGYGTVRLYDPQHDSFCWGSWILRRDRPDGFAMESAMMVYEYGLDLGFDRSHFTVHKLNSAVWAFHERFGAVKVGEIGDEYAYEISRSAILDTLGRNRARLPQGIHVIA